MPLVGDGKASEHPRGEIAISVIDHCRGSERAITCVDRRANALDSSREACFRHRGNFDVGRVADVELRELRLRYMQVSDEFSRIGNAKSDFVNREILTGLYFTGGNDAGDWRADLRIIVIQLLESVG